MLLDPEGAPASIIKFAFGMSIDVSPTYEKIIVFISFPSLNYDIIFILLRLLTSPLIKGIKIDKIFSKKEEIYKIKTQIDCNGEKSVNLKVNRIQVCIQTILQDCIIIIWSWPP